MTAAVPAACARCGQTAECAEGGLPSGWSIQIDNGRVERICAPCARANIRSIEEKLSPDYWDA